MKRILLLLTLVGASAGPAAFAAGARAPTSELRKLDVSVGRWIFHGRSLNTAYSKAGTWTWHENCRWSANRLFLECSFDNVWSGKRVRSLVVDTYNSTDKTFWHYEFFAAGASGKRPFVSRMTIDGDTWVEYSSGQHAGKPVRERIVYRFAPPARVTVSIELSRDGKRWTTIDRGKGVKQT